MSNANRNKLVLFLFVVCVIVSLGIWWAFMTANTPFVYFLAIFNLLFGPTCLVFYLLEVKRGVFAVPEGEEED